MYIDDNNRLVDGQHRIQAVIKAKSSKPSKKETHIYDALGDELSFAAEQMDTLRKAIEDGSFDVSEDGLAGFMFKLGMVTGSAMELAKVLGKWGKERR